MIPLILRQGRRSLRVKRNETAVVTSRVISANFIVSPDPSLPRGRPGSRKMSSGALLNKAESDKSLSELRVEYGVSREFTIFPNEGTTFELGFWKNHL
jgi:hypothetical protein